MGEALAEASGSPGAKLHALGCLHGSANWVGKRWALRLGVKTAAGDSKRVRLLGLYIMYILISLHEVRVHSGVGAMV